jgi:hypothetical protein
MVMRPRHVLAAAAILTAVTLGSWAALSTDSPKPAPQAAGPLAAAPATPTKPRVPHVTKPDVPEVPGPRPCLDGPAGLPRRPAKLSRIAGDFDGDHARDQVDANGDGRDEGFVTSTGGASNDAYNLFGLAGCQLRQVRIAGSSALQILVGASVGHAEGFDCQSTDRQGRRLLTLWGVQRADQQPDGGSTYTYTKTSYRWAGSALVREVDTDHGGFATVADGLPGMTSDQGHDQLPAEFTTRCGGGSW